MPTVPVKAAGWRIEPPVSVAVAPRQRRAATAAAEPPEEPPGTRCAPTIAPVARLAPALDPESGQGYAPGATALVAFDEPGANSPMLSLPSITAPSCHRLWVTADS